MISGTETEINPALRKKTIIKNLMKNMFNMKDLVNYNNMFLF